MTKVTYRAGIVGLGFIGGGDQVSGDALGQRVADLDGTHLTALAGNERVELTAGSSRDPGRRQRFEQRTGCRTYPDWREMIGRERLDVVSVATYAPQHAEVSSPAPPPASGPSGARSLSPRGSPTPSGWSRRARRRVHSSLSITTGASIPTTGACATSWPRGSWAT
ncbi:MAG TPA: Gfo/Idh/MocA family oxidoreductase [Gemmataceae bacterium]|nr:Gfo/Idh/MocA family oxidoreductase [Gemmataceae bacterium]